MRTWFLDTGFVIALTSPRDQFHSIAEQLSETIETEGVRLVTSDAVILEIGAALAKLPFRSAAVRLIESMRTDSSIEIVELRSDLVARAFQVFRDRADKEWSLTACVSFEIMRERQLTEALTPDAHFIQAGWVALMRA